MYKKVTTTNDKLAFQQMWEDFCEEKQIHYVNKNPQSFRYIILDPYKKAIGTLEYSRYIEAEHSNVEAYYPFSQSDALKNITDKQIYEITKMGLGREHRGKGYFHFIMLTIYTYAIQHDVDWFLAVMTYRMYLFLRTMGFHLESVAEPFWLSEQMKAVPVLLDAKHGVEHMKTFKRFQHYCRDVT